MHKDMWEVELHLFLSSTVDRDEWLASRPCHFKLDEKASGTQ
jgi:hypothetical protein